MQRDSRASPTLGLAIFHDQPCRTFNVFSSHSGYVLKLFTAMPTTETNIFSPIPTGMEAFTTGRE